MSKIFAILIPTGVMASALFVALSWLRLHSMQRALDGLMLPDLLVGGYDLSYVERVQSAMTGELFESYAFVHYVWGILLPLTFAVTVMMLIIRVSKGRAAMLVLLIVPMAFAGVDIVENILIETMFATVPANPELVAWASTFTVLKFILFAACLLVGVFALLFRTKTAAQGTGESRVGV